MSLFITVALYSNIIMAELHSNLTILKIRGVLLFWDGQMIKEKYLPSTILSWRLCDPGKCFQKLFSPLEKPEKWKQNNGSLFPGVKLRERHRGKPLCFENKTKCETLNNTKNTTQIKMVCTHTFYECVSHEIPLFLDVFTHNVQLQLTIIFN